MNPESGADDGEKAVALKLDMNERCEGPPDWVRETARDLPAEVFWRYEGRADLEAAIAAAHGLNPGQVLAANGGDEAIFYLFSTLAKGAPVVLPRPTFGMYAEQARNWSVPLREIPPLPGLGLDLAAVRREVGQTAAGLVVLVRPNNPTGESPPLDSVLELTSVCREKGVTLLVDQAYVDFTEDDLVPHLAKYPNLLLLRTFSKAYGLAGLRVGYLLGDPALLAPLRSRALPFNVSSIAQHFVKLALEPAACQEKVAYAARIAANRDALYQRLRAIGIAVSQSSANFLCLSLGCRRAAFVHHLLATGGLPVRAFDRAELAGCLRVTIPLEDGKLVELLMRALAPQLICLDVDGCLIDVRASFDAVVTRLVRHFTGETIDVAEIYALRAAGGYNDDNLLAHELIRQRGVAVPLTDVLPLFREYYLGSAAGPGLCRQERAIIRPEILSRLCDSYAVALVTGRNREELASARRLLELRDAVHCMTLDDVSTGKPDPEGILTAARHARAERVWMIGDNVDDIAAARRAGAVAIGVAGNREALLAAGADVVLDSVNQISDLLGWTD